MTTPDAVPVRPRVVVMGVSGAGKSTIGAALAEALGEPFIDADDLHSPASKRKMAAGIALGDEDRWPWLRRVGSALDTAARTGDGVVVACSALRAAYRDVLRTADPGVVFVHLSADAEVIRARIVDRAHDYMPSTLLDSQFSTLEPLEADEPGFSVDVRGDVRATVERVLAGLATRPGPRPPRPSAPPAIRATAQNGPS